ncbi:Eco57I restriction-modification methylase domain-containing protein [Microcella sp.]|uniref:Eco57I restriction-modification methylase domain-containing protein n=1 Tax=Microcella sp. TaxID=1913979 RepID=UPI003F712567
MANEAVSSLALRAAQAVDWSGASPAGALLHKVYIGPDPDGLGGLQIATATVGAEPGRGVLDKLFTLRKGSRTITLVVAVTDGNRTWLYGPDPRAEIIVLAANQAQRQLQSVLDEPDSTAAFNRIAALRRQVDSGGVGWTNNGLFAKHHLEHNVPSRLDWTSKGEQAKPLLALRGKQLIDALGFRATAGTGDTQILAAATGDSEEPRAVAVLLDESEHFDAKSPRYQLTPIAFGLAVAQRQGLPWVIGLRKDALRLYPGTVGVGVGQKGQVETFFEIDLSSIDDAQAALLALVFSAAALAKDGTTDELLRDSARYAIGLGLRLRQRIYEEVVPPIARAVAERLPSIGLKIDTDGLHTAYALTLRILFRLLFQAYAEDRGLLPSGRNEGYDANSLKTIARRNLDIDATDFGDAASIWLDLVQVWNAIDQGNKQWQVPAYNGGLFASASTHSSEGALLAQLSLPDSVLGPALQHLLVDVTPEGVPGPVDFRALSVREFGTIYEGLLESSLSIADADLTTDRNGAWKPAVADDLIEAPKGSVYFHGASGERKATGSYFTPKVVVDHLIERSITPALEAHLEKIAGRLSQGKSVSRTEFFDFRVADLAMGSGHFLVAAIDKIEALMRTFLTEHDVPDVRQELLTIAGVARDALGSDEVAKSEVEEVGLLRRQIARRCIYGLDINPLAVELARLALWIHTFVPGLPMSNLDHGLVCANSLTGIGTIDEAIDSLVGAPASASATPTVSIQDDGLFGGVDTTRSETGHQLMVRTAVTNYLKDSLPLLADVANAAEAGKAEVQRAAELLAEAKAKAAPASRIFDAAVAVRLGLWSVSITKEEHISRLVDTTEPATIVAPLKPAHMPVLFPEVFVRETPGFDVLLGNPPWEEVMVEEPKFWLRVRPGLLGLKPAELKAEIERLRSDRADLLPELQREIDAVNALRKVLLTGPYPGLGTGDVDLYQAFAWRYWHLLREGGTIAFITPRSLMNSAGTAEWRKNVLPKSRAEIVGLINNRQWVFLIHPQYSMSLSALTKTPDGKLQIAGPFSSESEFLAGRHDLGTIDFAALLAASEHAALPNLPDSDSVEIFTQLRKAPRLDAVRPGWDFRPVAEFHATNDRPIFDAGPQATGRLAVRGGAGFDIWTPETAEIYAWADQSTVEAALQAKRRRQIGLRAAAFYAKPLLWAADPMTLPYKHPRIAFRDVTNATNTRTSIAALVPPGTLLVNSAPYAFRFDGDESAEAYLLGVLCSIPLDWYSRKYVELHMNLHIFNGLPIPTYDPDSPISRRVVVAAGRLAAIDERFSDWAAQVGVEVGSAKDDPVKSDLIAELDALVSLLFGLSAEQVRHVFATFHRGWDYQDRLDAVLEHYEKWAEMA